MTIEEKFSHQVKVLIDDLKSVCANYGLGNDGNEFKIITQVFLYKFLHDKFVYEVKQIDEKLKHESEWEKHIASYSKEEFEITSDFMKEKYRNLIMYDNIRSLDDCLREISKHKPDVVIDDYIQLIQVDGIKEGRRFEIEKIMQEYKWISKSEDCSVILVSQLNREIEKRIDPRPRMSDYAESGVIEQTAESAMFVFYGHNFDSERYD